MRKVEAAEKAREVTNATRDMVNDFYNSLLDDQTKQIKEINQGWDDQIREVKRATGLKKSERNAQKQLLRETKAVNLAYEGFFIDARNAARDIKKSKAQLDTLRDIKEIEKEFVDKTTTDIQDRIDELDMTDFEKSIKDINDAFDEQIKATSQLSLVERIRISALAEEERALKKQIALSKEFAAVSERLSKRGLGTLSESLMQINDDYDKAAKVAFIASSNQEEFNQKIEELNLDKLTRTLDAEAEAMERATAAGRAFESVMLDIESIGFELSEDSFTVEQDKIKQSIEKQKTKIQSSLESVFEGVFDSINDIADKELNDSINEFRSNLSLQDLARLGDEGVKAEEDELKRLNILEREKTLAEARLQLADKITKANETLNKVQDKRLKDLEDQTREALSGALTPLISLRSGSGNKFAEEISRAQQQVEELKQAALEANEAAGKQLEGVINSMAKGALSTQLREIEEKRDEAIESATDALQNFTRTVDDLELSELDIKLRSISEDFEEMTKQAIKLNEEAGGVEFTGISESAIRIAAAEAEEAKLAEARDEAAKATADLTEETLASVSALEAAFIRGGLSTVANSLISINKQYSDFIENSIGSTGTLRLSAEELARVSELRSKAIVKSLTDAFDPFLDGIDSFRSKLENFGTEEQGVTIEQLQAKIRLLEGLGSTGILDDKELKKRKDLMEEIFQGAQELQNKQAEADRAHFEAIQKLTRVSLSLRNQITDLLISDFNITTPAEKLETAKQQFITLRDEALAAIESGAENQEEAVKSFQEFATKFLEAGQEVDKSGAAQIERFGFVTDSLQQVADAADLSSTDLSNSAVSNEEALGKIVNTLDVVSADLENKVNDALGKLLDISINFAGEGITTVGGVPVFETELDVVTTVQNSVNGSEFSTETQFADMLIESNLQNRTNGSFEDPHLVVDSSLTALANGEIKPEIFVDSLLTALGNGDISPELFIDSALTALGNGSLNPDLFIDSVLTAKGNGEIVPNLVIDSTIEALGNGEPIPQFVIDSVVKNRTNGVDGNNAGFLVDTSVTNLVNNSENQSPEFTVNTQLSAQVNGEDVDFDGNQGSISTDISATVNLDQSFSQLEKILLFIGFRIESAIFDAAFQQQVGGVQELGASSVVSSAIQEKILESIGLSAFNSLLNFSKTEERQVSRDFDSKIDSASLQVDSPVAVNLENILNALQSSSSRTLYDVSDFNRGYNKTSRDRLGMMNTTLTTIKDNNLKWMAEIELQTRLNRLDAGEKINSVGSKVKSNQDTLAGRLDTVIHEIKVSRLHNVDRLNALSDRMHKDLGDVRKKLALGGMINGPSHAQGGVPIEAEGGEFIISKKNVQRLGVGFLERLNSGGEPPEGVKFQSGGIIGSVSQSGSANAGLIMQTNAKLDRLITTLENKDMNVNIDVDTEQLIDTKISANQRKG